jgi:hypothetical protein
MNEPGVGFIRHGEMKPRLARRARHSLQRAAVPAEIDTDRASRSRWPPALLRSPARVCSTASAGAVPCSKSNRRGFDSWRASMPKRRCTSRHFAPNSLTSTRGLSFFLGFRVMAWPPHLRDLLWRR